MSLANGAVMRPTSGEATFALVVSGDLTIPVGCSINGNGRGSASQGGDAPGTDGAYRIGGGGGGHAGRGGAGKGNNGSTVASAASDALFAPVSLGSGGGLSGSTAGGAGGGLIRLDVAGTLTLDGAVTATGSTGKASSYNYAGGGGAGGTLDITAGSLVGSGTLSADGGAGGSTNYARGGGGGGGRIRVIAPSLDALTITAHGGDGPNIAERGGAGTRVHKTAAALLYDVVLDNGGATGAGTPLTGASIDVAVVQLLAGTRAELMAPLSASAALLDGTAVLVADAPVSAGLLTLTDGSSITYSAGGPGLALLISGDMLVDSSSTVTASGRGLGAGDGAGAAGQYRIGGGGGGHGGLGGRGNGNNGSTGNAAAYGDVFDPSLAGSGGGSTSGASGGTGGGVIDLQVGGTLTLNGTLQASGTSGGNNGSNYASGGGAGGSVYVSVGDLAGPALPRIIADGGSGGGTNYARGGGGAGGRIRVDSLTDIGVFMRARGGFSSSQPGAAGTILQHNASSTKGWLLVDNVGRNGPATPLLAGANVFDSAEIRDQGTLHLPAGVQATVSGELALLPTAQLTVDDTLTVGTLDAFDDALLNHTAGLDGFHIVANTAVVIRSGARINVDALGFTSAAGPGAGGNGEYRIGGAGGAHGGNGGQSGGYNGSVASSLGYDSLTEPGGLGSGGGSCGSAKGGVGGGRIVIDCQGPVFIDGDITANGTSGGTNGSDYASGGGAGGSIAIKGSAISGVGLVEANGGGGGDSSRADGGGGGGGRIALTGSPVTGLTVFARGGSSPIQPGGAGTLIRQNGAGTVRALSVDNLARNGALSRVTGGPYTLSSILATHRGKLHIPPDETVGVTGEIRVENLGIVRLDALVTAGSVVVESGGVMDHSTGASGFELQVAGNATVLAGGTISANGRGFGPALGPGAGTHGAYRVGGSGAAHGGVTGASAGNNGSVQGATAYGDPLAPITLGSGGGNGGASGAGGGNGGGRLVMVVGGTLAVEGTLSANGSSSGTNGSSYAGGGGAGGTLDITAATITGAGTLSADGGNGGNTSYADGSGGAGGRIRIAANAVLPLVSARAGTGGARPGGAGTIFLATPGRLVVDGGDVSGSLVTPMPSGDFVVAELLGRGKGRLTIASGANLTVTGAIIVEQDGLIEFGTALQAANVVIESGGVLSALAQSPDCHLLVSGVLDIQTGGALSATGRGHASETGPGAGTVGGYNVGPGGGGYGCNGGNGGGNSGGKAGGASYGDAAEPVDMGSGGGSGCNGLSGGGGGGRLRVTVAGATLVNGTLSANGGNGGTSGSHCAAAGGSGGTLDLLTGSLAGSGEITANGGTGGVTNYAKGGGGGGGRARVRYSTSTLTQPVRAFGGTGYNAGCVGSVVVGETVPAVTDLVAAGGAVNGTIDVSWSDPAGVDGLHSYTLRVLDSALSDANFAGAPEATPPAPAAVSSGTVQNHTISGNGGALVAGQTYWIALRVVGPDGIAGALSNVVSVAATGDAVPPAAVDDLVAAGTGIAGTVDLSWTAPSDVAGTAAAYAIRWAPASAPFDWATATPLTAGIPVPAAPGTLQSMATSELAGGVNKHIVIRTTDDHGNTSANSNAAFADVTPPVVVLTTPGDGATVQKVVVVEATSSDDVAVTQVVFELDGDPQLTVIDTGEGFSWTFDTSAVAAGAHAITARAVDAFDNTGSDSAAITVVHVAPTAPVILTPPDGLSTTVSVHDVVGTADAGTTVVLSNGGVLSAGPVSVLGEASITVQPEAAGTDLGGCVVDAAGTGVTLADFGAQNNVALGKPATASTTYSSTFAPTEAVDGVLENGSTQTGYWLTKDGTTGYLQVDLLDTVEVHSIRVMNCRNANYLDRSTKDYRLEISTDGSQWTTVQDGVLPEDDISNWQVTALGVPQTARWVRFWVDSYYGNGGGLAEIEVYASPPITTCQVRSNWTATADISAFTQLTDTATLGAGGISHEFSTGEAALSATFDGAAIDDTTWLFTPGVSQDGAVQLTGTVAWGNTYIYTQQSFPRTITTEYRAVLKTPAGRGMIGLKRPAGSKSYTGMAHAVYFDGPSIKIYEDGAHKSTPTSIDQSLDWEVRFQVFGHTKVLTWLREANAGSWTLLRESSLDGGPDHQFGLVVYDGTLTLDNVVIKGDVWHPAAALADTTPGAQIRIRSTLTRPTVEAVSPVLDAVHVGFSDANSGQGLGTFRFQDVALNQGDNVLSVVSTDGGGHTERGLCGGDGSCRQRGARPDR